MSLAAVVRLVKQAKAEGRLVLYRKSANSEVRLAKPGERIATIIHGVVETEGVAGDDDVIIRNLTQTQEQYLLARDDFEKRYTVTDKLSYEFYVAAKACGLAYACVYKGEAFTFATKWGNTMLVEYNDRLAVSSLKDLEAVYRIEKTAFLETYSPAGGSPAAGVASELESGDQA